MPHNNHIPSPNDDTVLMPTTLNNGAIPIPNSDPNVQQKLQHSLSDMERAGGIAGWCAEKFLSAGDWIERELEERRQTIGGIDNLFLLLTDATDFNPVSTLFASYVERVWSECWIRKVCACMFTMKGKLMLGDLHNVRTSPSPFLQK